MGNTASFWQHKECSVRVPFGDLSVPGAQQVHTVRADRSSVRCRTLDETSVSMCLNEAVGLAKMLIFLQGEYDLLLLFRELCYCMRVGNDGFKNPVLAVCC